MTEKLANWKRGDVVAITDLAHQNAMCVLTSDAIENQYIAWLLIDETRTAWRGTDWVEAREPRLMVRAGAPAVGGEPEAADPEALVETANILADPETMAALSEARSES